MQLLTHYNITRKDLQAVVIILILGLGIIPILPNHTLDPWGLFNPQKIGILLVVIALVQFGCHMATRVFGQRTGLMISGFIGGLISSTIIFATLPQLVKKDSKKEIPALIAAIFSIIGSLMELMFIISIISWKILSPTAIPIIAAMAIGIIIILLLFRYSTPLELVSPPSQPLDIFYIFRLAIVLTFILTLVTLTKQYFGENAGIVIIFLGGLFELHATTFASALLYVNGKLSQTQVSHYILTAVFASFISKYVLLVILARNRYGIMTAISLTLMVCTAILVYQIV